MPEPRTDLIRLTSVTYTMDGPDGTQPLLTDIDIALRPGEWLAVVGTNGSGKSTLAKLMAGLLAPTAGELRLSAQDGAASGPTVQLVFQNPELHLLSETVLEEVCFGMEQLGWPRSLMLERAAACMRQVDLTGLADRPVASLSGGQKQLLAIASCLAVRPAALLFDEATSMLDPLSSERVLTLAGELHRQGVAIVWITQLLDELSEAGRVLALHEGRIVFEGSPRAFFYERKTEGQTPCERLGFPAPYTVQVAEALRERGFAPEPPPLTPEQLAEAVKAAL